MHLERILIVVERRVSLDGSYPGFDIRHMEAPLKYLGIIDNIDILYYADYSPNCDDALLEYCRRNRPQAVLLSLQNLALREGAAPTPGAVDRVTRELGIPTVMFWYDTQSDTVAEVLERYLKSITLNVIPGTADAHRKMLLKGTNYVHAGMSFDEHLFDIPEVPRDIPVGFMGILKKNRSYWIDEIRGAGVEVYLSGGGGPGQWMPYEEYLRLMSRFKIALNFSLAAAAGAFISPEIERPRDVLRNISPGLKKRVSGLLKNPLAVRQVVSLIKDAAKLAKKPRYNIRARVWEALWCRTFLLEEKNPVTSRYFDPYVDYVPFDNLKDLKEKIGYYLEHDEERDRIRRQGHATIRRYQNARIYWENLFEVIGLKPTRFRHRPGETWSKEHYIRWYKLNGEATNLQSEAARQSGEWPKYGKVL
jgi:hypothetical protein